MKSKRTKIIIGLILMPIFTLLFFIDRFILFFLFWIQSPTLFEYFNSWKLIKDSAYRLIAASFFYTLFKFFAWIF